MYYYYFQGDYIRHPVLYELSHKYGVPTDSVPESSLPCKLEELKELIRREIRKELKIKEGAEKLREVATDRKSLSHVATIVKNSNSKLAELKSELSELESQIILTHGQTTTTPTNGQGNYIFACNTWTRWHAAFTLTLKTVSTISHLKFYCRCSYAQ